MQQRGDSNYVSNLGVSRGDTSLHRSSKSPLSCMGIAGILGTKLFKLGGKRTTLMEKLCYLSINNKSIALYYSVPRPKKYSTLDLLSSFYFNQIMQKSNNTNYLLCALNKSERNKISCNKRSKLLSLSFPISVLGHQKLSTLPLRLGPDCLSPPETGARGQSRILGGTALFLLASVPPALE